MGNRNIVLVGFEAELLAYIAANFRFSSVALKSYPLEVNRNLFEQDTPDVESIKLVQGARVPAPPMAYDSQREPTISIYTQPGGQIGAAVSSDSKHAWSVLFSLRLAKSLGAAKDHLAELCQWMEKTLPGKRTGVFVLRSANLTQMPAVFIRGEDEFAYASATLRILGVPLPQ